MESPGTCCSPSLWSFFGEPHCYAGNVWAVLTGRVSLCYRNRKLSAWEGVLHRNIVERQSRISTEDCAARKRQFARRTSFQSKFSTPTRYDTLSRNGGSQIIWCSVFFSHNISLRLHTTLAESIVSRTILPNHDQGQPGGDSEVHHLTLAGIPCSVLKVPGGPRRCYSCQLGLMRLELDSSYPTDNTSLEIRRHKHL